jgi:hypothetical protein
VKNVIDTYQVGQQGIEGGGFGIMDYNEGAQYLYVQFQSYKNGYNIDDAEFWYNPEKKQFDVLEVPVALDNQTSVSMPNA